MTEKYYESIPQKLDVLLDEMTAYRREAQDRSDRLSKIEAKLESLDEIIDTIVKIIRGDGNGDKGVLMRLQAGGFEMRKLAEAQNEIKKDIQDIAHRMQSGTMSTKERVRAILNFLGPIIVAVISAIAATKVMK